MDRDDVPAPGLSVPASCGSIVGLYPVDSAKLQSGVEASFSELVNGLARQPGLELHVITFVPGLAQEMRR